jgi:hypothetical protein
MIFFAVFFFCLLVSLIPVIFRLNRIERKIKSLSTKLLYCLVVPISISGIMVLVFLVLFGFTLFLGLSGLRITNYLAYFLSPISLLSGLNFQITSHLE